MYKATFVLLTAVLPAACGSLPLESVPRDAGTTTSNLYHPVGWALPENHGPALKKQSEDCRMCHGGDLRGGGSAPGGCEGCHAQNWRTDCTFCHGGIDNLTGAPPRDLLGETDPSRLSFPAHTAHVSDTALHAAFDCNQCHTKPTDILSQDHIFDDTPDAKVEMNFTGGLSARGTFANGTCSNLYCHGSGSGNTGTSRVTDGPKDCGSCHATSPNTGAHGAHRRYACNECHGDTVNRAGDIVRPELHVNGRKDTAYPTSNMVLAGTSCTGTCHGESHRSRRW